MRKPIMLLLILSLFCLASESRAQNAVSERVEALLKYCTDNFANNWSELRGSLEELSELAPHTGNEQHLADTHKFWGIYHYRTSQYDSSLYNYGIAAELNTKIGNEEELSKNLVNISMCYRNLGDFEKTIEKALEAARIFDRMENFKGQALVYNMIGSVHYYQGKYEEAIVSMRRYLEMAEKSGDLIERGSANQNLGAALQAAGYKSEAMSYYEKGLSISKQTGHKVSIGNNSINLASMYMEEENFGRAIELLQDALSISKEIQNPRMELEAYFNLGTVYLNSNQNSKAVSFALEALRLAQLSDDLFFLMKTNNTLAKAYYNLGNYQLGFEYLQNHIELKEKIVNEENLNKISELETLYETEKKENQIRILEQDRALQKLIIQRNKAVQGGMALLLVLLVAFGLLWNSRNKAKQEKQLQMVKVHLREEQLHAVISSQELERKRFAEDLHDGFGQLISALKLNISHLNTHNPTPLSPEKRNELYESAIAILNEMYGEVRTIAFNLMPTILVQKGLVSAVEHLAERINQSGKMFIRVHTFDLKEKLEDLKEISLYRVVQEILTNMIKYSGATKIDIQFVNHGAELILTIEDDGLGFDPNVFTLSKGNGWKNIQSRLNLIKAELEIDSAPGRKGSTWIITLPLHVNKDALAA
jgi:two-component system, NarL family, sensor kinase